MSIKTIIVDFSQAIWLLLNEIVLWDLLALRYFLSLSLAYIAFNYFIS